MLKNFNKLPKQPKYFNIYNSYHSMFTWPPFLFFQHYQQYDTLLPITPCTHNMHLGPLDLMVLAVFLHWIHGFILFMKSEVLCLYFPNDVSSFSHEQHRCTWMVQSGWFLPPHHLTRHHFLPYHLDHLFHYHIHPEQAQDQPTTQVKLFLQNHKKKIIIWYIVISKISKNIQTAIFRWKLKKY